ncbi:MAG TPA: TIGR03936 family radical SAM-associated protein [Kineosporiaceae bacterium]|nr:TIGR03936 family radical SAM-associated protein [Kineosporiaceae bacterium]
MARTPDGPPPEPAVQRLRLRYAKRGRLRFASHRDLQRSFERALRRADIPVAYSAGFSPHPRISYAGAAPTGAASEAEYLEIAVTARCDPGRVRAALDAALPAGLDVLEVVEARTPSFAERLEASVWAVELPGVAPRVAATALSGFLSAGEIQVQRLTKNGLRTFDARGAVVRAEVEVADPASAPMGDAVGPSGPAPQAAHPPCAILHLVVRHTTPAVRPDDVLAGLRSHAQLAPPSSPRMTRLAQGPLDEEDGSVADPLTADRGVGGA